MYIKTMYESCSKLKAVGLSAKCKYYTDGTWGIVKQADDGCSKRQMCKQTNRKRV